jgi:hypothetical protein
LLSLVLLLLLLASLLAAAEVSIAYNAREDGQTRARTFEVTDWSSVPRVWTAALGARLREKPATDAPVSAELPFGAPVQVLEAVSAEPVAAFGRSDRWYRVATEGKAGYLFGDALTSARFEDDFDGDREPELATVAFTADFKIRVRFFEPKTKTETFIDLEPAGGAYLSMQGGYAYPEALKRSVAGLPLVHVGSHVEACADFVDYWVSYDGSAPKLAMRQAGLTDFPSNFTYKVEFQPAKRRALVHFSKAMGEDLPPKQWTETWPLEGRVFVDPNRQP